MTYQLSHLVVLAELPGAIGNAAIERQVAFYLPGNVYHAAYIRIIVRIPLVFLVDALRQCLVEKLGKQIEQEVEDGSSGKG